jgi:hypothetical protein
MDKYGGINIRARSSSTQERRYLLSCNGPYPVIKMNLRDVHKLKMTGLYIQTDRIA